MDLTNILIIVSAVVFILLLWAISGLRHFRYLKKSIENQWEIVMNSLNKRQDLLPNLVESVKSFSDEKVELLEQLTKERALAAREYSSTARKVEYEHDLSISINKVIDFGNTREEMAQDTNFLELRKDLDDVGKGIEMNSKKYNEMVRYYNKHRQLLFLLPLAIVFGFHTVNIFEIEL